MAKLPYKRYALFLMLEGMSDDALLKHLDDLSFTQPDKVTLAELQEDEKNLMLPPAARRALRMNRWDPSVQRFLDRVGLGQLYAYRKKQPDKDMTPWESVQIILGNPVQRVALETALLAQVPSDELASLMSVGAGTHLTREVLELFKSTFFDTDSMGKSDWREYIKMCAGHAYVYVRYLTGLTRPRDEALHLVGITTKVQLGSMLNEIAATAQFRFQHYVSHGNSESDKQARAWAKLGIEAGLRADKFAASDIKDFASAVQAEFEMVDSPIPQVDGEMLAQVKAPPADDTTAPVPPSGQPYVENQNV